MDFQSDKESHTAGGKTGRIVQLVKAESGSTVQNVVQQVFVGDYERLRDAYIHPWPVFERVDLDHLAGREWLLAEVDAFLRDHDRGYFILEAEAGLGKTTFLAWLVRKRGYIHHFVELASGLEGMGRGLKNLASQLILKHHLSPYEALGVLPGIAARSDFLYSLLKQAADQRQNGEKIVLVVDALDEAGTLPSQNALGLPQVLPEGVYVIASQRPVRTLYPDTATVPYCVFTLSADSNENQADMYRFLEDVISWPGIADAMQQSNCTPEQFSKALLEKCQGVWIYLHFVVHEIESGQRGPLDLNTLPNGIVQYYAQHWRCWRDRDETKWYEIWLPLLTTLAAAQEPVTADLLVNLAGVKLSTLQVCLLLNELWRPFLAAIGEGTAAHYRFYHTTLVEFFDGRLDRAILQGADRALTDELVQATRDAHSRIADRYLADWGGLEGGLPELIGATPRDDNGSYGLRHIAAHLTFFGRTEDLHHLLELETDEQRNGWYEVKRSANDAESYVDDIYQAWQAAEKAFIQDGAEARGQSIGLQVRYALITTSLNSLAKNIPPELLVALVCSQVWPLDQGLAYARLVPDVDLRFKMLSELALGLADHQRIEDAFRAVRALGGPGEYDGPLRQLAVRLAKLGHLERALVAIEEIEHYWSFADCLIGLAPYLAEEQLRQALALAEKLDRSMERDNVLSVLIPQLAEMGSPREALALALESDCTPWKRARILAGVATYLPESEQTPVWRKALEAARETERYRGTDNTIIGRLAWLAPLLPEPEWQSVWREAFDAALEISFPGERAEALASLLPRLSGQAQAKARSKILSLAQNKRVYPLKYYAQCLIRALSYLQYPERKVVWQNVLALAQRIRDVKDRRLLLDKLIAQLIDLGFLGEALAAVEEMKDSWDQAEALVALAPHLHGALLWNALSLALKSGDIYCQTRALDGLAPRLPQTVRNSVLNEALEATNTISEGYERSQALSWLAPHFPPAQRDTILKQALDVAEQIGDAFGRSAASGFLAPDLPEPLIEEALTKLREIQTQWGSDVFIAPAAYSSDPRLEDVWQDILAEGSISRYASIKSSRLLKVVFHAPKHRLRQVFKICKEIEYAEVRVDALITLAPYLPPAWLGEVLAAIQEIESHEKRHALIRLAPYLPVPLIREALAIAKTMPENEWWQPSVLAGLMPYLDEPERSEIARTGGETIRAVSLADSKIRRLAGLSDVLSPAEYESACIDALRAIDEFKLLWSAKPPAWIRLAPHLPSSLISSVWQSVKISSDGGEVTRVTTALTLRLAELGQPDRALQLAQKLRTYDGYWIETIHHLIPRLVECGYLQETLSLLLQIDDNSYLPDAIHALTPCLLQFPALERFDLWRKLLHNLANRSRVDLCDDLETLSSLIYALGGQEAVEETYRALQDVGRWWP